MKARYLVRFTGAGLRAMSSFIKSGAYDAELTGETEVGRLAKTVLKSRNPKWVNKGTVVAEDSKEGTQLKASFTPAEDDNQPPHGMKGIFEILARIKHQEDKAALTDGQVVKGTASVLGFELDLSGKKASGMQVPIKIESEEGKPGTYTIMGKVDASTLKEVLKSDVPKSVLSLLSMFSSSIEVRMTLTQDKEQENQQPVVLKK